MSNRRKIRKASQAASSGLLKVALQLQSNDPTESLIQVVFRPLTFGDVGAANAAGAPGSGRWAITLAERSYLRTERPIDSADLMLSWGEILPGALSSPDLLGRIQHNEAVSNLHRVLNQVTAFSGFDWDRSLDSR